MAPTDGPAAHLAAAASPYLRRHAVDTVPWRTWGDAALAEARERQVPVFLSIGYSTCYWCHVLQHESFADPEIGAYLGTYFVPVLVDREERPDVDRLYMEAALRLRGHGGWPLNLILTPEGVPLWVGTYLPPRARGPHGGLLELLHEVVRRWRGEREVLERGAARVAQALGWHASADEAGTGAPVALDWSALRTAAWRAWRERFDPRYGGYGTGTKFPMPPVLLLALRMAEAGDAEANRQLETTARAMATGGLWDQLGGGFHRYTVDPAWQVPHFEKMLYDNGLLLGVYAELAARDAVWRPLVERLLTFLDDEFARDDGLLAAAFDADVEGHEGRGYVWRRADLAALLSADEEHAFAQRYRLVPLPEEPEWGVLVRVDGRLPGALEPWEARLLAERRRRWPVWRDDKAVAAWNAYVLWGWAVAVRHGLLPGDTPELRLRAWRSLRAFVEPTGAVRHLPTGESVPGPALLVDAAAWGWALVEVHRATGDPFWLEVAARIVRWVEATLGRGGSLRLTTAEELPGEPPVAAPDGAEPGPLSLYLGLLRRLSAWDPEAGRALERWVRRYGRWLVEHPDGYPFLWAQEPLAAPATLPAPPLAALGSGAHVGVEVVDGVLRVAPAEGWHLSGDTARAVAAPRILAGSVATGRLTVLPAPDPSPTGALAVPLPAGTEVVAVELQVCDAQGRCAAPERLWWWRDGLLEAP